MIEDKQILIELERLAAAFPWEDVGVTINRKPEGDLSFTAVIHGNREFATSLEVETARELSAAVDRIIVIYSSKRDPKIQREKKIEELKEQIRKLEAVRLLFPPYVPNRELAQHCQRPAVVDIQTEESA